MFYDEFIRLCVENKETPSNVAKSIGVDKSAATRWSKGSVPRGVTLMKLANHFGVSVAELLGESADQKKAEPITEVSKVAEEDSLAVALEVLRNQPGRRALLSATKNMTEAQVLRFADWLADITGGDKD